MNRAELIEAIVANKNSGAETKAAGGRVLEAVLQGIAKGLKKTGAVSLVGFGTFKVKQRPARKGRNPQTGATITIKARKVVGFKPSADLKKSL